MRIGLVATRAEGHQLSLHARALIREFRKRGWTTTLFLPSSDHSHPTLLALQEELPGAFDVAALPQHQFTAKVPFLRWTVQRIGDSLALWRGFGEAVAAQPVDFVFPLGLEEIQIGCALKGSPFGPTPFGGILLSNFGYQAERGMPTPVTRIEKVMRGSLPRMLRLGTLRFAAHADPLLVEHRNHLPKLKHYPEKGELLPLPEQASARALLGLPADAFIVVSYGWQTGRKGIREFVRGIQHPDFPADGVGYLVGSQQADAREFLATPDCQALIESGKLIVCAEVIDNGHEAAMFAATDAVWIGYPGFYTMSGVLMQSWVAGKPVLAGDHGIIGHLVQSTESGRTFPVADTAAYVRALLDVRANHATFSANSAQEGTKHGGDCFERTLADFVQDAMKP